MQNLHHDANVALIFWHYYVERAAYPADVEWNEGSDLVLKRHKSRTGPVLVPRDQARLVMIEWRKAEARGG